MGGPQAGPGTGALADSGRAAEGRRLRPGGSAARPRPAVRRHRHTGPEGALGAAEAALLLTAGMARNTPPTTSVTTGEWMHELPPLTHIRRQSHLDVHHNLLPETARLRTRPEQVIAASRTLEGYSALRRACAWKTWCCIPRRTSFTKANGSNGIARSRRPGCAAAPRHDRGRMVARTARAGGGLESDAATGAGAALLPPTTGHARAR